MATDTPTRRYALPALTALAGLLLVLALWRTWQSNGGAPATSVSKSKTAAPPSGSPGGGIQSTDGEKARATATKAPAKLPHKLGTSSEAAKQIQSILSDTTVDNATARERLLDIVKQPGQPANIRTAALTHALHLLPDTDYLRIMTELLDVEMAPEVFAPAWQDLFERPTPEQLQMSWTLAQRVGHSHQEPATEFLERYIGPQADRDPAHWKPAIDAYLKAHPP